MAQKYIQDPLRPGVSIPNPAYFAPAKPVVADNLMNPATPAKLPSAPAMPDYNTLMAQGQALLSQINDLQGQQSALKQYGLQDTNQLQKDPETGSYVPIQAPQAPAQSQESEMTSLLKSYLGEMPEPVNPADSYQKALEASGMQGANQQVLANQQSLTKAQSELGMINANLQSLVGQTQQRQLEIAGEPISAGAMQGRNIDEARNLAIRAIPYQVQVLAKQAEIAGLQGNLEYSQGLLEQAKTQLNTMFDLENDYQQRLYEYNQRKIDAVYEFASKEQQAKLDAKKVEEQRKWEEKQSEIEYERDVEMRKLDAQLEAQTGGSTNGLTANQINSTVNQIAGAFDNEPIVKNYNTAQEGYQTLQSIGVNTKSPADDIAFIYAFAKIMDPNSVVREGEYATVQKYSQSWAESFGFKAKRVFSNTNFLSSDAKQKMLNALTPKLNTIQTQYSNVYDEYQRQISDAYAGKPRQITDYSKPFDPIETNKTVNNSSDSAGETAQTQGLLSRAWNWLFGD